MAIVAVSVAPTGSGVSVGAYVAEALRVLEAQQRVRFEIGPMFTTLEGDLAEIFELILRMQEAVFAAGAARVSTVIKVDERRDRPAHMDEKVASVRERLRGRPG
ncbi:MTH1187 family thiamine-binding protein [Myxococcota bacterium]|nr:MTH1187 family thiamine-binding protein [Myxococcota bacterium]MCZ7620248.1 MTH1187 family thiamine-binding protein [Myxococcota bacterium]